MKPTKIKTYKNLEALQRAIKDGTDVVRLYDKNASGSITDTDSISEYNSKYYLRLFFVENLLEVVSRTLKERKRITKEFLEGLTLKEVSVGVDIWHCGGKDLLQVSNSCGRLNYSSATYGGWYTLEEFLSKDIFLEPPVEPLEDLVEVVPPWVVKKKVLPENPPKEFYVKIKTWKDMEDEFGLNYSHNINVKYVFTKAMEYSMPKDRIIKVICKGDMLVWDENRWSISEDMIESYIGETHPDESSKWLVKSIIEIIEVSGKKSLEELRKEYPNCLFKRSNEDDWMK